MNVRDFDSAEREILGHAPEASRRLYEVRLKLARERLACGDDVAAELAALRRGLAATSPRRSAKRLH